MYVIMKQIVERCHQKTKRKRGFLFMKHFLDITDFSREGLREMLNVMNYIKENRGAYSRDLERNVIINAFFKPDRDTKTAFSSAIVKMGGTPVDFEYNLNETLRDAVANMSAYGDAIVFSHNKKGAARAASLYATVPVINAGDGGRAYPVKTLSDFSSVWVEKKHVSNMKIGFLGDFTNNILVKNLLQCLNLYKGNEFYFISVNGKPLSEDYINIMDRREKDFAVYDNLFEILPELDVLYMTEVKKESFDSEIMYEARKHNFILDERMLLAAKPDLIILHQFPRGEELDVSVDADSRAKYFAGFNRYVDSCIAILSKLTKSRMGRALQPDFEESTHEEYCGKEDCITSDEKYLPRLFYETADGRLFCKYCGQELVK